MIEVQNLVKRYGDQLAVDHISFTIEEGQIYGFLGPNGAGKSTTMNIMTGYLAATEGEVLINGHNITDEPELAKSCIGFLPEIPPLYTDMTVMEYLKFAAELKKIPAKERETAIQDAIDVTKLEEVLDRLIGNLSKGYRQRVGLAQALIGYPEIIILDEPTVGLDPKQIIEMRMLIKGLAKKHTVILSSHILSEIQEVCDKVIIIHQGRLIANGTPAELEEKLGSASLEITVKTADKTAIVGRMSGIEGVISVSVQDSSSDTETDLLLKVNKDIDVREAVFNACVSAGCPLLMMKSTGSSLEKLFLELTKERRLVKRRVRRKSAVAEEAAPAEAEASENASADTQQNESDEKGG